MPFGKRETTVTVAASSLAAKSGYNNTPMTGFVDSFYIALATTATSTGTIVKITTTSTNAVIFTSVTPPLVGTYYRPRLTPYVGGTTAATVLHTSKVGAVPFQLFKDRIKVHINGTTDVSTTTPGSVTVRMRINPLMF